MPNFSSIKTEIESAFNTLNCIETISTDFGVLDPMSENNQANEPCKIVQKEIVRSLHELHAGNLGRKEK